MAADLKLVPFTPLRAKVHQSAVKILEGELARAKAGEVVGVAVATIDQDGALSTSWSRVENRPAMIGALAELQAEFIERTRP